LPARDRCGKLESECQCPPAAILVPPDQQTVLIAVEKRKAGKVVTVLRGLAKETTSLTSRSCSASLAIG
jgi:translation initiation factor 1